MLENVLVKEKINKNGLYGIPSGKIYRKSGTEVIPKTRKRKFPSGNFFF
jgi:hypothetical protein